ATCNEKGELSAFKNCATGACHMDSTSTTSGGAAYCETECVEGTFQCVPGLEAAATCTAKGRFDLTNDTPCNVNDLQNPEHCITNLGCAQCNPNGASANGTTGRPDVRCAVDENGLPTDPPA